MKRIRYQQRINGHNLLEMMIATVIFSTALISMASVYQYISMATAKSRTRLVGQYLAKGLMEKCVAATYFNVIELASVPTPTVPTADPALYLPPVEAIYRRDGVEYSHKYYREVQVDNSLPEGTAPGGGGIGGALRARVVRVKVSWEEKNRRTAEARPFAEYRTYIGENS